MSASGAGVLQLRSVEYARNHGVRIHCRSSFTEAPGTFVVGEEETMERPLITAVTHSTDEARVTLLGVPDHPGVAGRIFTALADANVNVDMIIQNEPVSEGARGRHVVHRPARGPARRARAALDPVVAELGIRAVAEDPEMGKVSIVGAGMKSHPGVAAQGLHDARRRGHQHRDDLDLADQDLLRRPRPTRVDRAVRALHEAFELGADQIEAEHPFGAASMSYRVAVVGATGAVGTVMLAKLRERGFPGARDRPVRLRALGRPRARRRDRPARSPTRRSRASTSRSSPPAATTSREWAPRFVDAGARRRRQLVRVAPRPRGPARRLRGQPGRARRPQGPHRQPELLDDAADGRAEADPRRGRHRAPDRLDLPVGVRHRREGRRRARGPDPRACCTASRCRRRRSTRTRSRSTCSAAPATSPTATTTPTRSAR